MRTFDYRTPEELYDLRTDPHVLKNLIEKSEYREAAQRMRQALAERMAASKDPMLEAFRAKVRVLDGEFYARATRSIDSLSWPQSFVSGPARAGAASLVSARCGMSVEHYLQGSPSRFLILARIEWCVSQIAARGTC